jgi:hypothetical protein
MPHFLAHRCPIVNSFRDFGEEAGFLSTLAGIYWVKPRGRQEHLALAAYM